MNALAEKLENAKKQWFGQQEFPPEPSYSEGAARREEDAIGMPPTVRQAAERDAREHHSQARKAEEVARFLALHPEFDEFIRLVRAGVIKL